MFIRIADVVEKSIIAVEHQQPQYSGNNNNKIENERIQEKENKTCESTKKRDDFDEKYYMATPEAFPIMMYTNQHFILM